jgi:4-hydroxy-3-methylbut-2-enyl diphosphate reductase IspH
MKIVPAHLMKVIPANHHRVCHGEHDALNYAQELSQQNGLRTLLEQVDAVVVVGGKNGNNTRQLLSTCRQTGTPSFHIERVEELSPAWFTGFEKVGVSADCDCKEQLSAERATNDSLGVCRILPRSG